MLLMKREHISTYTMAKLTEALEGGEQHVRAPTINQQQNTQMLNDHSSIHNTHTHTYCARTPLSTRVTHTRRLCFACRQPTRPALLRLPLPNGSLRLQRGRDASLPPSSFTLGGLSMGIWNWISCLISYSCVIFSNPFAASCLFLPKIRGGDEVQEAACV